MKEITNSIYNKSLYRIVKNYAGLLILFLIIFLSSCERSSISTEVPDNPLKPGDDVTAPVINSVNPANSATSVGTNSNPTVTFNEEMNPETINSTTFTLKQGTTVIPGNVTTVGSISTFSPASALSANTLYTGTITTAAQDIAGNSISADYTWSFTTAAVVDVTPPTVLSTVPASGAVSASTNTKVTITFSEPVNPSTINSSSFTLKQGSVDIPGTLVYSGNVATFTPSASLAGAKVYTVTLTTGVKDLSGNALSAAYTWNFTTSSTADATAPAVSSVTPVSNATSVALNIKPTITFSEPMDASTITSSTFTMKQGSTTVTGTVSYTATTATFTPSVSMTGNLVYTCSVTTAAKDVSGNALAAVYTWSFTTLADVTPPTVVSVTPLSNATSVAVNTKLIINFSEPMMSSSINSSTFTLKQGSSTISSTITYSANTATLTPSASLTGNTVYTGTVTTLAKDAAGNALSSDYTWTFTTVAVSTGKSFSADVMPVLNLCNTCHTHGWTPSSNASTFYTNLVSGGYVKPATPTTSKIYSKLSGGHPPGSTISTVQKNNILTWMNEGSKNN